MSTYESLDSFYSCLASSFFSPPGYWINLAIFLVFQEIFIHAFFHYPTGCFIMCSEFAKYDTLATWCFLDLCFVGFVFVFLQFLYLCPYVNTMCWIIYFSIVSLFKFPLWYYLYIYSNQSSNFFHLKWLIMKIIIQCHEALWKLPHILFLILN